MFFSFAKSMKSEGARFGE